MKEYTLLELAYWMWVSATVTGVITAYAVSNMINKERYERL